MRVQPIPRSWLDTVTSILRTYDDRRIRWTMRAQSTWQLYGLKQEGIDLLLETLKGEVIGQQVVGMQDLTDGSYADTWAFLCDNPFGSSVPLYAKIGLHHSQVYICLFSLHVDDGSKALETAIAEYHKRRTP